MSEESIKLERDRVREERFISKEREQWLRLEAIERRLDEERRNRTEPFKVTYLEVIRL